jgi:hypothetical protein
MLATLTGAAPVALVDDTFGSTGSEAAAAGGTPDADEIEPVDEAAATGETAPVEDAEAVEDPESGRVREGDE